MTTPGSARCSSTPRAPTAGARVRRGFVCVMEVCSAWIARKCCWLTAAALGIQLRPTLTRCRPGHEGEARLRLFSGAGPPPVSLCSQLDVGRSAFAKNMPPRLALPQIKLR